MVSEDTEIVTFYDNPECFIIFMGAWAKNALETSVYRDKLKGNMAGIESVIEFYKKMKKLPEKLVAGVDKIATRRLQRF